MAVEVERLKTAEAASNGKQRNGLSTLIDTFDGVIAFFVSGCVDRDPGVILSE